MILKSKRWFKQLSIHPWFFLWHCSALGALFVIYFSLLQQTITTTLAACLHYFSLTLFLIFGRHIWWFVIAGCLAYLLYISDFFDWVEISPSAFFLLLGLVIGGIIFIALLPSYFLSFLPMILGAPAYISWLFALVWLWLFFSMYLAFMLILLLLLCNEAITYFLLNEVFVNFLVASSTESAQAYELFANFNIAQFILTPTEVLRTLLLQSSQIFLTQFWPYCALHLFGMLFPLPHAFAPYWQKYKRKKNRKKATSVASTKKPLAENPTA